jgi:hypothetical protein
LPEPEYRNREIFEGLRHRLQVLRQDGQWKVPVDLLLSAPTGSGRLRNHTYAHKVTVFFVKLVSKEVHLWLLPRLEHEPELADFRPQWPWEAAEPMQ